MNNLPRNTQRIFLSAERNIFVYTLKRSSVFYESGIFLLKIIFRLAFVCHFTGYSEIAIAWSYSQSIHTKKFHDLTGWRCDNVDFSRRVKSWCAVEKFLFVKVIKILLVSLSRTFQYNLSTVLHVSDGNLKYSSSEYSPRIFGLSLKTIYSASSLELCSWWNNSCLSKIFLPISSISKILN